MKTVIQVPTTQAHRTGQACEPATADNGANTVLERGLLAAAKSARKSVGTNNSASKMPLVALIMQHAGTELAPADLARHLRLDPTYVRKASSRPNVQVRDGLEQPCVLDMKQLSVRVSALKTHILMQ